MSEELYRLTLTEKEMNTLREVMSTLSTYSLVNKSNLKGKEQVKPLSKKIEETEPVRQQYTPDSHLCLAVDMDSTIWTEDYPHFGIPYEGAIETVNDLVEAGYHVNIWTSRGGENMEACREHLVNEYGLNKDIVFNEHFEYYTDQFPIQSPKISAHIYFDDKAYLAPNYENYWAVIRKEFLG